MLLPILFPSPMVISLESFPITSNLRWNISGNDETYAKRFQTYPIVLPSHSLHNPIATWLECGQNGSNIHFKFSGKNPSRPNSAQVDTRCSLGCPDEDFNRLNVQCLQEMVKSQSG